MDGLIIAGYPGIGKSSYGGKYGCVDLESGNFYVGVHRDPEWYIVYCQIAIDLAKQGCTVFVSSHEDVLNHLRSVPLPDNIDVIVICPAKNLKEQWIRKLEDRFSKTNLDKDYTAMIRARNHFDEDIDHLTNSQFTVVHIEDMDYDLYEILLQIHCQTNSRFLWS